LLDNSGYVLVSENPDEVRMTVTYSDKFLNIHLWNAAFCPLGEKLHVHINEIYIDYFSTNL